MKKFIGILLLAALSIGGGIFLAKNIPSNQPDDVSEEEVEEQQEEAESNNGNSGDVDFVEAQKKIAPSNNEGILQEIASAKNKNKDTHGWIRIPNMRIDDPVLQSNNNEQYLRINEKGISDPYGAYFADFRCSLGTSDQLSPNTVIYGHSDITGDQDKPDGKDFSQLFKYLDIEFAKQNPYIYFGTSNENMVWEVFATFYSDVDFNYINTNPTEAEFNNIVSEAKLRSENTYNVNPTYQDKILTLSTCSVKYDTDKEQRFVVMARMVDNTTERPYTTDVIKNPDPKQPNFK